jgi:DNA (cytosine-5)-methyltransferase 1
LNIISLFSGAGGLDLGFEQEGFSVVVAYDKRSAAVDTYNHNREAKVARQVDLSSFTGHEIINEVQQSESVKPLRGVIGGPPCQPFSHSNVHLKKDDIRRSLPARYAVILKTLNEHYELDFFVFENVRGINFRRHFREFARFRDLFRDAGFRLFEGLLDAVDFGVPQKRPRVFVVGFNKEKYGEWGFVFPKADGTSIRTLADAIRGLPEPKFFERGLSPENIPHHPNHWTMQPRSEKFRNGFLKEGQNHGRSFRVLAWDKPSWAVAYGHREIHIHPSGKRRLSIYEAMLLQGFPKEYQLLGTLSDQVQQVSDAVPPPLARTLARSIRSFLEGDESVRVPHSGQLCLPQVATG